MYISDCTAFDSRNIACSRVMWRFELGCKGITYYLSAIRDTGGLPTLNDCLQLLFLAVEIDVAKVVFNENNLKDVVVAIAQKNMVVA